MGEVDGQSDGDRNKNQPGGRRDPESPLRRAGSVNLSPRGHLWNHWNFWNGYLASLTLIAMSALVQQH